MEQVFEQILISKWEEKLSNHYQDQVLLIGAFYLRRRLSGGEATLSTLETNFNYTKKNQLGM